MSQRFLGENYLDLTDKCVNDISSSSPQNSSDTVLKPYARTWKWIGAAQAYLKQSLIDYLLANDKFRYLCDSF